MKTATDFLNALVPLVSFVCLLFGILAAWKGLGEVIPAVNSLVPITVKGGSAQSLATVAGALALVVMAIRGKA